MRKNRNITGIILAGGKSSRMGTDKGFLKLNNKPFVQCSVDALKPLVSEIIIVSDHESYDVFGLKRVSDITKNAGPVAGICSGLNASKTAYNLILSCDVPLVTSKILENLIDNINESSQVIQVESNGKTMPLIAIYHRSVLSTFTTFLNNNERRLRMAIKSCKTKNIVLKKENEYLTMNVNSPSEFKIIKNAYNH